MTTVKRWLFLVLAALLVGGGFLSGAQAQNQDELVVGITIDIQTLDARMSFNTPGGSILSHVYESLVATDERGRLQPRLAERWEISDPQTIRFHLRRGVRFHNGDPLTADAVKFSIESRKDPAQRSPQRAFFASVDRVDVINAQTVEVKLNSPTTRVMLRTLAYYYGLIMPRKFVEGSGGRLTTGNGTGPYRLVEYRPGDRVVLERNARYWGGAVQGPSRMVFRVIPEAGTRVAALERGEIDIATLFPIDQIARFRNNPSLTVFSQPSIRIAFLGFHQDRKPMDDRRVREALTMAVDREELNRTLLGGRGRVANTFIAPPVFGYASDVSPPVYNPQRARELLAQAGQAGMRLRFGISNGRFINDRQIGEAMAAYFEAIGVRVELDAPEFSAFFTELVKDGSKYDAYMVSWANNTLDADFTSTAVFHQNFPAYTNYKNAELSGLIEQARAAVDERQALALYKQIQEIVTRELLWVPLVQVPDVVGARRNVQGFKFRADELWFFTSVTKR